MSSFNNIAELKKESGSSAVLYFAEYKGDDVFVKVHLKIKDIEKFESELRGIIGKMITVVRDNNSVDIFVNEIIDKYNNTYISEGIAGIEYENRIYSEIIKVVMDMKLCPNFVEFVDLYESSLAEFMSSFYKINTEDDKFRVQFGQVIYNIDKNLKKIFFIDPTPVGNTGISLNWTNLKDLYLEHISIHYLVTKRVLGANNTIKSIDFSKTIEDDVLKQIIFQLLYALYVMQEINLQHNDLHDTNILIETLPEARKVVYVVEGTEFEFETKYLVRIFDWDMAFVDDPHFGINTCIAGETFYESGILNKFVKNYDFFMIICYLIEQCKYNSQLTQRKTVCTTTIFQELFAEQISKNILTLNNSNNITGFGADGKFNNGIHRCRATNHELLLQFPELRDCLLHSIFDKFRKEKQTQVNAKYQNSIRRPHEQNSRRMWSCKKHSSL